MERLTLNIYRVVVNGCTAFVLQMQNKKELIKNEC